MQAPDLTEEQVSRIVPDITDVKFVGKGGQKSVFSCIISGDIYALKFLDLTPSSGGMAKSYANESFATNELSYQENTFDNIQHDVFARAKREIVIMQRCDTSTLVKLGPVGMNLVEFEGKNLLYFTEEWIEGPSLYDILNNKPLTTKESIQLASDLTNAIQNLWNIQMIHRDIKPKNIMRREDGSYVLLDTGFAFDLSDESLTAAFNIVGTRIYMSPEQVKNARRALDFRSDLFQLGIVLYEALSGLHPFYKRGMQSMEIFSNIVMSTVIPLIKVRPEIPLELNTVIMRLLAKQPHLRFKSCESIIEKLKQIEEGLQ
ncbi:serine/threonine-protein kinase [Desulfosporosinus sp.]|uniref:serine/threonine protein kinase n=1 Tax=Desulfosporosinus sp. TaxID=157907 RepID=UPI00262B1EEA|nr:serine/threonine-protein kinase [Desulfosporosinus sp.]